MTTDKPHTPFGRMTAAQKLYVALTALFLLCLVLGDITGGKAFKTALGPVSVGMILFPVTFLLTDVVNDFYGARAARFMTLIGAASATFAYVALVITTTLPIDPDSYFQQGEYEKILGGSAKLFLASVVAFLLGQYFDIFAFQFYKRLTRAKFLWVRATGSTVLSQLVDTVVINTIFWGGVADKSSTWIAAKIAREYGIKVAIAFLLTPLIYWIHALIERSLRITAEPIGRDPDPGSLQ